MANNSEDQEQLLRVIRFFLPRLTREQLAKEILEEKDRLRTVYSQRMAEINAQKDAKLRELSADAERARQDCSNRIAEIRRLIDSKIRDEENRRRPELDRLHTRSLSEAIGSGILLSVGILGTAQGSRSAMLGFGIVCFVSLVPLLWDLIRCRFRVRKLSSELKSLANAITAEAAQEIAAIEQEQRAMLVKIDGQAGTAKSIASQQVAATEKELNDRITALDARFEDLVRLYEESVAGDDEVVEFTNRRLEELREQVEPALGLRPDDVLDARCAEVWAPTFLQTQDLPDAVRRDIAQSEKDILALSEAIISPMKGPLKSDVQWQAFHDRVLVLLALSDVGPDKVPAGQPSSRLSSLAAVRFSANRQAYLAGHYFFQKIVCAEDFVGIFRAFVNILSRRVPHTYALQVMYTDVAAIGIETALNTERYEAAAMTIKQHTYTLALELTSGTTYRMSGDAGSAGNVGAVADVSGGEVVSKANDAFRDQVMNVRALIRDSKARTASMDGGALTPA